MCASQKSDWRYKSWLAVQSTMYNLIGNLHPSWLLNAFFTLFVCFTGNLWIEFLSLTIPGDIWRKSFSGINVAGNVKDDASWCEGASTTGKSHDWSSPSGLPPLAHPEQPQAPPLPPLATPVHSESCACKQHCPNGEEGGASLPYQKINSESFLLIDKLSRILLLQILSTELYSYIHMTVCMTKSIANSNDMWPSQCNGGWSCFLGHWFGWGVMVTWSPSPKLDQKPTSPAGSQNHQDFHIPCKLFSMESELAAFPGQLESAIMATMCS